MKEFNNKNFHNKQEKLDKYKNDKQENLGKYK